MADSAKRTISLELADLREDYRQAELSEGNCETNPFSQFAKWFKEAQVADLKEPNAMSVATATPDGRPSVRIVLLKDFSDTGFIFYTSYSSRKGKELGTNPFCALLFYWAELERQVRLEGEIHRVPREQTEAYFRRRPKGSRLGALVSNQSEVLLDRSPLEERLEELERVYKDREDIPAPDYWGGYCVAPSSFEFWQGRSNRLHDRMRYQRKGEEAWVLERLSP